MQGTPTKARAGLKYGTYQEHETNERGVANDSTALLVMANFCILRSLASDIGVIECRLFAAKVLSNHSQQEWRSFKPPTCDLDLHAAVCKNITYLPILPVLYLQSKGSDQQLRSIAECCFLPAWG
eukprot:2357622-Amphidinium_carterae.1